MSTVCYVAESNRRPTPAELIEQLRVKLGDGGEPLSDDKMAKLIGVPTRQQVIGWRVHGLGMSRKYAERFAALDGEHTADDYLKRSSAIGRQELAEAVGRLERVAVEFARLVERVAAEVEDQLRTQTELLAMLQRVAESLVAELPARPPNQEDRRTG